jgi:hypothetical protein
VAIAPGSSSNSAKVAASSSVIPAASIRSLVAGFAATVRALSTVPRGRATRLAICAAETPIMASCSMASRVSLACMSWRCTFSLTWSMIRSTSSGEGTTRTGTVGVPTLTATTVRRWPRSTVREPSASTYALMTSNTPRDLIDAAKSLASGRVSVRTLVPIFSSPGATS